jgi:hypothetical protein
MSCAETHYSYSHAHADFALVPSEFNTQNSGGEGHAAIGS